MDKVSGNELFRNICSSFGDVEEVYWSAIDSFCTLVNVIGDEFNLDVADSALSKTHPEKWKKQRNILDGLIVSFEVYAGYDQADGHWIESYLGIVAAGIIRAHVAEENREPWDQYDYFMRALLVNPPIDPYTIVEIIHYTVNMCIEYNRR